LRIRINYMHATGSRLLIQIIEVVC